MYSKDVTLTTREGHRAWCDRHSFTFGEDIPAVGRMDHQKEVRGQEEKSSWKRGDTTLIRIQNDEIKTR